MQPIDHWHAVSQDTCGLSPLHFCPLTLRNATPSPSNWPTVNWPVKLLNSKFSSKCSLVMYGTVSTSFSLNGSVAMLVLVVFLSLFVVQVGLVKCHRRGPVFAFSRFPVLFFITAPDYFSSSLVFLLAIRISGVLVFNSLVRIHLSKILGYCRRPYFSLHYNGCPRPGGWQS